MKILKFSLLLLMQACSLGDNTMDSYKNSPNFSPAEEIFQNEKAARSIKNNPNMSFSDSLKVMYDMFAKMKERAPHEKLPEVQPIMADFIKPDKNLKFIWIGHSTFIVNLDGKIILFDPVFSDYAFTYDFFIKRFQSPAISLNELPKIDYIVLSHNHYDHLDEKSMRSFKDKNIKFFIPLGVASDLIAWGIAKEDITEFDWYQNIKIDSLEFTFAPAKHFSGRGLFDRNKTLWGSWIVQGERENLYFSGDSGYGPHFKHIGDKYGPFDITFLENGQYDEKWPDVHMMPDETIKAYEDLKGKKMVPVHWGMFVLALHHWTDPVEKTYSMALAKNIPFIAPLYGEIVNIGDNKEFAPWWKKFIP